MAAGFGNTGAVTYTTQYPFLTGVTAQQITGPGWTAATGDVTPIGAGDNNWNIMVISGRRIQEEISVPFFMNAAAADVGSPTDTKSQAMTISYPDQPAGPLTFNAGMTFFKYGDLISDEVMVGECRFMPVGGIAVPTFPQPS